MELGFFRRVGGGVKDKERLIIRRMLMDGVIFGAVGLLVYAALHDLAARTVPNWLPLCLLAIGLAARIADHNLWAGLMVSLAAFVILFGIWFFGAMGGGDVKLWAATVLLIPPHWQPQLAFFLRVLLLGGGLALLYLALWWPMARLRRNQASRLRRNQTSRLRPNQSSIMSENLRPAFLQRVLQAEIWRIARRGPLPYALAISASAIVSLLPLSSQQ